MRKFHIFITIILIPVLFIYNTGISNGYTFSHPKIEILFSNFTKKLENKYTLKKQISILEKLNQKISQLRTKNLDKKYKNIITDLEYLSTTKIKHLKIKNIYAEEQVLKQNNEEVILSHSNKEKIKSFAISKYFKNISYDKNNIFLLDGVWYAYIFDSHLYFKDPESLNIESIKHNNINTDLDLLFLTGSDHVGFAKNYKVVKLASDTILQGLKNKYKILIKLKKDKTKTVDQNSSDSDELVKKIIQTTRKLSENKSNEEKIAAIYNYIIQNIHYTSDPDLELGYIFSGIETFKNKHGVCEGYAELFYYMLEIAGIDNIETETGLVIDAQDFPQIGHAWVRIGDKYYDPTFDDPVGLLKSPKPSEYKYFGLPKDLFYTNRYKYEDAPKTLNTTSLEYRKNLVKLNRAFLAEKYNEEEFNLLKLFKYKSDHGFSYNEQITTANYTKIAPIYTVENLKFMKGDSEKTIKSLQYYQIRKNSQDIENLLEQENFNLSKYTMLKWLLEDGKYEYRLAYDIVFH